MFASISRRSRTSSYQKAINRSDQRAFILRFAYICWRTAGRNARRSPCFDWVMSKQTDPLDPNWSLSLLISLSFYLSPVFGLIPPRRFYCHFIVVCRGEARQGRLPRGHVPYGDVIAVTGSSSSRIQKVRRYSRYGSYSSSHKVFLAKALSRFIFLPLLSTVERKREKMNVQI